MKSYKKYEIQSRIIITTKNILGFKKVKKSESWLHWKYYKTMEGMLQALRYYKNTFSGAAYSGKNNVYTWEFRPAHNN